jgi:NAD+ synthase (glutamine-hydrolysing)
MGATFRVGPELEISGYGCEDHFFEIDTVRHSWSVLHDILADPSLTKDILCDIGMPVLHKNSLYNCRILCLNQRIHLIRPKCYLAGGNNYREGRWFTAWRKQELEEFVLDPQIQSIIGQETTPIGNAIIQCRDSAIACEICEEIWAPKNLHVDYGLDGVEIISNASGSHHELRKLGTRYELIENASRRNGGVYLYSNLKGCDGGRILFDGASLTCLNGKIINQMP